MKHLLFAVTFLLVAACASAQPRPIAGTTIFSTDLSVLSICAGANSINAPSSCLGGLQAGATVVNQALTLPSFTPGVVTSKLYNVGGTLTWNGSPVAVGGAVGPGTIGAIPVFTGANSIANSIMSQAGTVLTLAGTLTATVFGTSSFTAGGVGEQAFVVRNTTAGVGNFASLNVGNNVTAALGSMQGFSSTFTTAGSNIASGVNVNGAGVGGLSLVASDAAGIIHFFTGTGTVERGQITAGGLFSWSTFGAHAFAASDVGQNALNVTNTLAGAGNSAALNVVSNTVAGVLVSTSSTFTTSGQFIQASTVLDGNGVGGVSLSASHASGAMRFYAGGSTQRWGINAAGDWVIGTTPRIVDSVGVPTVASGFGGASIAGNDFAFFVNNGAANTGGVVTFGHAFSGVPVCVATAGLVPTAIATTTSTTQVTLAYASKTGDTFNVICRAYNF